MRLPNDTFQGLSLASGAGMSLCVRWVHCPACALVPSSVCCLTVVDFAVCGLRAVLDAIGLRW